MDESADSGWIKGLPAGWVDGFICARRLFARLQTEGANADPAPWHNVVNADYWGPHFGKSVEEHVRNEKLIARLVAIIQKAAGSGKLAASWFDGLAFKSIPTQAFAHSRVVYNALLLGGFEVDPLWPDEWQPWSGHGWAIPKAQFEEWIGSDDPISMAGLPMTPETMPTGEIVSIDSRNPSEAGRVPLSEAVTWIAFRVALDAERLERAIQWERLCSGDLQQTQRMIEAASANLLKAGADGQVSFFGRHVESYENKGQRTEQIDPLALIDYRQILITGHDHLYYGDGLKRWYQAKNDTQLRASERRDLFTNVTVARDALLKHFGSRTDTMAALLMPIPAALPDVGAVMGLEEAICLLAYDRPSHDTEVWMDRAGNMLLRDPAGMPVRPAANGEKPPHLVAFMEANRRLWKALQDGSLRGLVAPADSPALSVPRIYWNAMNPDCLAHVYDGTPSSAVGRGCPILLSRQALDQWRAKPALVDDLAIYAGGVQYEWVGESANSRDQNRQKPGPKADPDWPGVVSEVTQDCIAAGYRTPLQRGQKAAIGTLLLGKMAVKNKYFSEDAAAKYAEKVIAALPDNST